MDYIGKTVFVYFGSEENYDELTDVFFVSCTTSAAHFGVDAPNREYNADKKSFEETGEREKYKVAIPLDRILEVRVYLKE